MLAFKFEATRYNTTWDQHEIPESIPVLSLGTVQSVGNEICHFVAFRNETGKVTFLQSTIPLLSYGNFVLSLSTKTMITQEGTQTFYKKKPLMMMIMIQRTIYPSVMSQSERFLTGNAIMQHAKARVEMSGVSCIPLP